MISRLLYRFAAKVTLSVVIETNKGTLTLFFSVGAYWILLSMLLILAIIAF